MFIVILNFLKKLGLPVCRRCQNLTLRADMCKSCVQEDDLAWDLFNAQQEADEAASSIELDSADYRREVDKQNLADLMASFCTAYGCYEAGDYSFGDCRLHTPEECCHDCGYPDSQCTCIDDDTCPGICNQPVYACTCAKTESLRRHNADPATSGSYWTA